LASTGRVRPVRTGSRPVRIAERVGVLGALANDVVATPLTRDDEGRNSMQSKLSSD
jgi:hypothetical protein